MPVPPAVQPLAAGSLKLAWARTAPLLSRPGFEQHRSMVPHAHQCALSPAPGRQMSQKGVRSTAALHESKVPTPAGSDTTQWSLSYIPERASGRAARSCIRLRNWTALSLSKAQRAIYVPMKVYMAVITQRPQNAPTVCQQALRACSKVLRSAETQLIVLN